MTVETALLETERPHDAPDRFTLGDPLRAIAALSVLTFHAWFYGLGLTAPADDYQSAYGVIEGTALSTLQAGLYIFFVLSGYLISRPFVRSVVLSREMPHLGRYLGNRLLRIVPAFWVVFTVVLLIYGRAGASWPDVASIYAFGQNMNNTLLSFRVGPAWTLGVELGFYLLVPVAAALAARVIPSGTISRRGSWLLGILAVTATASLVFREVTPEVLGWMRSLPSMLFAFLPGVALAVIETCWAGQRPMARRTARRLAAGLLLIAGLSLIAYARAAPGAVNALLIAAAAGSAVAAPLVLQWARVPAPRALDSPILHWLGVRSYSIYLVHQPVILALIFLPAFASLSDWQAITITLAVALAGAIAISVLLYAVVERPFLALRSRPWTRRPRSAQRDERLGGDLT